MCAASRNMPVMLSLPRGLGSNEFQHRSTCVQPSSIFFNHTALLLLDCHCVRLVRAAGRFLALLSMRLLVAAVFAIAAAGIWQLGFVGQRGCSYAKWRQAEQGVPGACFSAFCCFRDRGAPQCFPTFEDPSAGSCLVLRVAA